MKIIRTSIRSLRHLTWLRFGVKDRLARFFHNPNKAKGVFEVDFYGLRYVGDFGNFIDWSTYYFGAYAENELQFFADVLKNKPDAVVLDIGGNIGHHSLYLSTISGVVHAFEPYEKVLTSFRNKAAINKVKNLHIHPYGMGDSDELLTFYTPGDCNAGTGSFVGNDNTGEKINLQVRNADKVVGEINLDRVDLIKIDVEGFELNVLRGLKETLNKFKPVLFFEWSLNERDSCSDLAHVLPAGYEVYRFSYRPVRAVFFQESGYQLTAVNGVMIDGNLVAIHRDSRIGVQDGRVAVR